MTFYSLKIVKIILGNGSKKKKFTLIPLYSNTTTIQISDMVIDINFIFLFLLYLIIIL